MKIKKDGQYTFFTEHMPFEFEANEHFFKDAEDTFRNYDGRPHCGKCNYLTYNDFSSMYAEGWDSFWKVQRDLDPKGLFLNSYLQSLQNSE
mgnify:CR=1 FL=1